MTQEVGGPQVGRRQGTPRPYSSRGRYRSGRNYLRIIDGQIIMKIQWIALWDTPCRALRPTVRLQIVFTVRGDAFLEAQSNRQNFPLGVTA
jgi:hypothetical protein